MLHDFLDSHRAELIDRCRSKSAHRSPRSPNAIELDGIPILIAQLVAMLRLSPSTGYLDAALPAEIRLSAKRYGAELLRRGFSLDQVVHDYGDLCQAVTELAHEQAQLISVDEFHTFNRCLDSAIADAVSEFGRQSDTAIHEAGAAALNVRMGSLAHELRNALNTAMLAYAAIKAGNVAITGATGSVLDRSLETLRVLIERALSDVRLSSGLHATVKLTPLDEILQHVRAAAQLDATARNIVFDVSVAPDLSVLADQPMLSSALINLLQNAFKFSRLGGHVSLTARVEDGNALLEIADECGGLGTGFTDPFKPFQQAHADRSGVGLGLAISRRAVEMNGGTLTVRDVPGSGCVFTVALPQQ